MSRKVFGLTPEKASGINFSEGFKLIEKKILLVDDEKPHNDVMQQILLKLEYESRAVNSPMEALQVLEDEEFPLIITDLNMPEINGVELCRRIRQVNSDSIIYALSGFINNFDMEKLEKAGFDGYLCKPINIDVLKQAVGGAFDKIERKQQEDH